MNTPPISNDTIVHFIEVFKQKSAIRQKFLISGTPGIDVIHTMYEGLDELLHKVTMLYDEHKPEEVVRLLVQIRATLMCIRSDLGDLLSTIQIFNLDEQALSMFMNGKA